jgi:hypothetical protein
MPVIYDGFERKRKIEIHFDHYEMVQLLHKYWPSLELTPKDNIRFYVDVPSGGDYSGMSIDIDKEHPLKIYILRDEGWKENK